MPFNKFDCMNIIPSVILVLRVTVFENQWTTKFAMPHGTGSSIKPAPTSIQGSQKFYTLSLKFSLLNRQPKLSPGEF